MYNINLHDLLFQFSFFITQNYCNCNYLLCRDKVVWKKETKQNKTKQKQHNTKQNQTKQTKTKKQNKTESESYELLWPHNIGISHSPNPIKGTESSWIKAYLHESRKVSTLNDGTDNANLFKCDYSISKISLSLCISPKRV